MIVKSITLSNFRNHAYQNLTFGTGINTIDGPNASGKTNIIEAIFYLSLARSFRGVEDQELIKHNCGYASSINAKILEGNIVRNIAITISEKGRKILINGKPISRIGELSKIVNAVIFEPKDAQLFKSSPKERRSFLDMNISKKSLPYFDYISRYEKVLKERNEILKLPKIDDNLLAVNTEMLVKLSDSIISYREAYIQDLNKVLGEITYLLTGKKEKIEINYKPFVAHDTSFQINASNAFNRTLENDIKHKATSIGIHREDFSLSLGGKDIATYGSQGENRLAALSLKISPYFLIEDRDKRPIVILDDVMSELDSTNQKRLTNFLKKLSQVFITGTKLNIEGATHFSLKQNKEVF